MHCKITSNAGNWRLVLIHLLKFIIIIFCSYGALLSAVPAVAAYTGIQYNWMPDSKVDMLILVASATFVILSYFNLYDTYDISLGNDIVVLGLIILISACSMDPMDLGVYTLIMLPMLVLYNHFSDIHRTLLQPQPKHIKQEKLEL